MSFFVHLFRFSPQGEYYAMAKASATGISTVAFKASTQNQKANLVRAFSNICCRYNDLSLFYKLILVGSFQSRSRVSVESATADLIKTSKCFGSAMLMKILGNYCRNRGVSTAIRVGIVGKTLQKHSPWVLRPQRSFPTSGTIFQVYQTWGRAASLTVWRGSSRVGSARLPASPSQFPFKLWVHFANSLLSLPSFSLISISFY